MIGINGALLRRITIFIVAIASVSLFATQSSSSQEGDDSAVLVEEQVARGEEAYLANCASCHAPNLRGGANEFGAPALTGPFFFGKWDGRTWTELLDYARDTMPPGEGGSLPAETYVDIIAHVADRAGHELSEPLSQDAPFLAENIERVSRQ